MYQIFQLNTHLSLVYAKYRDRDPCAVSCQTPVELCRF